MVITSAAEPTIQQRVEAAISDEPFEMALYDEESNSLAHSQRCWRAFDTVHELPDRPLGGWEELVVFTEAYVYRWVETGYSTGPERTPRNPETMLSEAQRPSTRG